MRQRGVVRALASLLLGAGFLLGCSAPPTTAPDPEPVLAPAVTETPKPAIKELRFPPREPPPPAVLAAAEPADAVAPVASPALPGRLEALLTDPALGGARIAVSVLDGAGIPVLEVRADQPLLPASTQKLVAAAGALAVLGSEFRYVTRLTATQEIDADGVLPGDLVLVGSGDPALATPLFGSQVYPERPRTPLESLADQAVAAGLRHVTGGVLGDPRVFADEPVPEGWLPRYFDELDAAHISGLTVDGGRKLAIRGSKVVGEVAPDPAAEAAASLFSLLADRGVTFGGGVGATRTPPEAPLLLGAVSSARLGDLLTHVVQRSDNHMAEHIYRTVGAAAADPGWAGAATATRAALAVLGLDWTGVTLADGSGLSRLNTLPTGFLARLDLVMSRSSLNAEWESLMARSGHSGTLRRRLLGTVAEQRLRGKTGSLRDVRSLSGAIDGPDGARYYFAVIANDLAPSARAAFRTLADELVLALAEDLYECVRIPRPDATPDVYDLACAS